MYHKVVLSWGQTWRLQVKPCAYTLFSCGLYLEKLQGSCALPQGESEAQTLTGVKGCAHYSFHRVPVSDLEYF